MVEIKGRFGEAKVFSRELETYARAQIQMICDDVMAKNSRIRIMPDVHPGKVGPIGLTMTFRERIIPQLLGIDIGCGVLCVKVNASHMELQKLDRLIRERIPAGFSIRDRAHNRAKEVDLAKLRCSDHIDMERAAKSLGTLGGGNHFIEVDRDEDGNLYLTIHTGSRHLGKEIAEFYVRTGARLLKKTGVNVPYEMTYIEGMLMKQYLFDIEVARKYAELNRDIIMMELLKGMKLKAVERFDSVHNYVEETEEGWLLRKGATSAGKDETVIIPVNMKDGVLLGVGKGNPEWNYSAPHGSGRKERRDQVKMHHTVSEYRKEMKGIYSTCIYEETLTEAPFAYRSLDEIRDVLEDTVKITKVLKPVFCFKAAERR